MKPLSYLRSMELDTKYLVTFLVIMVLLIISGCAQPTATSAAPTPVSAYQSAINSTYASYSALDAAVLSADAAVGSGVLKGQDARNTLKGLTDAKIGLDLALATLKASTAAAAASVPASGVKP